MTFQEARDSKARLEARREARVEEYNREDARLVEMGIDQDTDIDAYLDGRRAELEDAKRELADIEKELDAELSKAEELLKG